MKLQVTIPCPYCKAEEEVDLDVSPKYSLSDDDATKLRVGLYVMPKTYSTEHECERLKEAIQL